MNKYYKFTKANREAQYVDGFVYPLGEWMLPVEGNLALCRNGYHAITSDLLLNWINEELYEVELRGDILEKYDKIIAREIRLVRRIETWNDQTARLFMVWRLREALKLTTDIPHDYRSVAACDIAERYANGKATNNELTTARYAASSAARKAKREDAGSAVREVAMIAVGTVSQIAWSAMWTGGRISTKTIAYKAQNKKLVEMLGL